MLVKRKVKLHKRICGHRSGIINNVNAIVYQHFNQPDHSFLSMRVRIIKIIYHRTNNPNLATPLRRQYEDYWIRELETATPYGCNDKIDGIGILSSPTCRSVNVMNIFNSLLGVNEAMVIVIIHPLYVMMFH